MEKNVIRVLQIDDDEDAFVITRDLLREITWQKFKLDWVADYEEGLREIEKNQHDVILVDYRLGKNDGLLFIRQAMDHGCKKPMILLTGQGDRDVDLEAAQAGAVDYLTKGEITPSLLERSIRYAIRQAEIQEKLRHLAATLEERVEERTTELKKTYEKLRITEEQFYQAQKMESLGLLAGGIAHDFANYLAAICLQVDRAFLMSAAESANRDVLAEIRKICEEADEVVRQILLFSRKQPSLLPPIEINLNEAVSGAARILLGGIGEKWMLNIELDPGAESILSRPENIQQILMNLVTNARDAMPQGGIITISTRKIAITEEEAGSRGDVQPGRFFLLSVRDTGMGINPEIASKIFDPFFTTKETGKGTGLGLSVVYGIVKQNGGWIEVQSSPGQGSIFNLYFPAARQPLAR